MEPKICQCFLAMITNNLVSWFSHDNGKILIMPHIPNTNYRYNNCPCCSKEVRGIEVSREQIKQMSC